MSTLIADETYASIEPITDPDASLGYPLRALVRAIGTMFAQTEEAIRALGDGLDSWERLWNPDLAPDWLLPFVGQAVGVSVDTSLTPAEQRAQIKEEGGWHRGTPTSLLAAIQQTLGHANFVPNPGFEYDSNEGPPVLWLVTEGFGTKAGAEYSVFDELAHTGRNQMQLHSKGGQAKEGVRIALPGTFRKGTVYTVSFWVMSAAGGEISARIGSLAGGNEHAGALLAISASAWVRYSTSWTPTADVSDVWLAITNPKATVETYSIDDVLVEAASTASIYFDGDGADNYWLGTPGQSASVKPLSTPGTIRLVERNSTPWTALITTRPSETPNPTATKNAATSQKPGGMIFTLEESDLPLVDEGSREIDLATTDTIDTAVLADVT